MLKCGILVLYAHTECVWNWLLPEWLGWLGVCARAGNLTWDQKYSLCSKDKNMLKDLSDLISISFQYQISLPAFSGKRRTLFQHKKVHDELTYKHRQVQKQRLQSQTMLCIEEAFKHFYLQQWHLGQVNYCLVLLQWRYTLSSIVVGSTFLRNVSIWNETSIGGKIFV